ncbi:CBS domain-containing protein [Lacihabitans sp. CCS-44]|uniref:CBS domain-containing protein n=1 Tax=Lacihabitans sp. CCS-44 TaxID=2487331 RepID=UPI0020CFDE54|nr:CBS domain-containing protein [Lacihabitans sp. CCS-44]MCP9756102.1 CBS domain-containing protein [Lacihabitans sp. CCS-44]
MPTSVKTILSNKKIQTILSILPSATVFEALEVMSNYNIGALLVMENEKLVGIFSERDYARKGIVQGRSAKTTLISEVMTANVYTVESKMTSKDCMEIMNARKFRHLPVVDGGTVMGVLSVGDIVGAILDEQKEHIKYLESYIVNG